MHNLEPHYNWRHFYAAENDSVSPFYGREYSEFTYSDRVYNHLIHPQWDYIESPTLFLKILYCNYDQAFAATLRASSFRLLLALSCQLGLTIEHVDVKNAYTQAEMDHDVWVEPPKGFETYSDSELKKPPGARRPNLLKLRKALYGTKNAGRLWSQKLRIL